MRALILLATIPLIAGCTSIDDVRHSANRLDADAATPLPTFAECVEDGLESLSGFGVPQRNNRLGRVEFIGSAGQMTFYVVTLRATADSTHATAQVADTPFLPIPRTSSGVLRDVTGIFTGCGAAVMTSG